MFVLSTNGDMICIDDDNDASVIAFDNAGDETEWRCAAYGEGLSEEPGGYANESGKLVCGAYDPDDDPDVDDVETAPDLGEGSAPPASGAAVVGQQSLDPRQPGRGLDHGHDQCW